MAGFYRETCTKLASFRASFSGGLARGDGWLVEVFDDIAAVGVDEGALILAGGMENQVIEAEVDVLASEGDVVFGPG
jgi:hypothetical protein